MKGKFKEPDHLKEYNRRLQAVTTLLGDQTINGIKYKDGTPIVAVGETKINNESIFFELPNMTAVFLEYSNNLYEEHKGFFVFSNFTRGKKNYAPNDYDQFIKVLQSRIGSIIFSFSAIESFINDSIPEDYIYTTVKGEKRNKKFIEEKFPIKNKIDLLLKDIFKIKTFDKSISDKFDSIKYLRDRIVHLKNVDKVSSDSSQKTIRKDFLRKDFINYSIEAKDIIGYFLDNKADENIPRRFYKIPF